MSVAELQNYTFVGRYARWIPEKKRRETWKESVDRVKNMMLEQYPDAKDDIDWAYDLMHKKRVLGSQRALQFGGKPIIKHNARVYNCIASYSDRPRFFQETMYLLLCGCGVGFSVQKHHVEKLPRLVFSKDGTKKYTIPDTIEGWSDAIGVLVSSYFEDCDIFPEYMGKTVSFDYSEIRPAGSYLSSSSGKAPGPEPLKKALTNVKKVLDRALKDALFSNRKLRPIDVYDVVMHAA
ncbi:MAG: recombinase, partial [Dehalococcoidia bacterium]|nr:recombinase [Dehalococcoidia bacterium]